MGDFNVLIRDIDSIVTGYGKHQRVFVALPMLYPDLNNKVVLYCRVDRVNGLPNPTIKQILQVARSNQGVMGKFKLLKKSIYGINNKNIDYLFERI